jgi:hypothetical protein
LWCCAEQQLVSDFGRMVHEAPEELQKGGLEAFKATISEARDLLDKQGANGHSAPPSPLSAV